MPHPTLLVMGREDRVVDPEQTATAVRTMPNGRVVPLSKCGPAPRIERAGVVNRLVVDFLTQP